MFCERPALPCVSFLATPTAPCVLGLRMLVATTSPLPDTSLACFPHAILCNHATAGSLHSTLADTLRSLQPANFKPYRHADPTLFGRYMDAVLAPEKSSVAYLASVVQLALAAAVLAYYLGAVPWLIGWV